MTQTQHVAAETPATNEAYHQDSSAISHSMLEVFRQSAALYHARFVARTIPAPEATPAMALGTAVHAMAMLDNHAEHVVAAPECDRRTKDGKAAWSAFTASANGKIVLSQADYELARAMSAALTDSHTSGMLLAADGPVEAAIYWCDRQRRCKPDKLAMRHGEPVAAADIKTAADPSPEAFRRTVAALGYHRQAAWYLDGIEAEYGVRPAFYFLVVGKEPPHEVAVYELDDDALELGRRENQQDLARLMRCADADVWRSPWTEDICKLSLPRWAYLIEESAL